MSGEFVNSKCYRLALVAALIGLLLGIPPAAMAVDPIPGYTGPAPHSSTSIQFEGCNLDKSKEGTYDPLATPPVLTCDSGAIWPVGSDAYTSGNLGKEWEELDLVPHRFGTDSSGSPLQTYQIVVGADNLIDDYPLKIGYDQIANFVFNAALSTGDAGQCQLTLVGGNSTGDYGIGGAMEQIVQVVEITQAANTKCVWDYVERLAITSSRISGSSNRSYIVAGTGQQSIPIPSDISPQALSKEMSAVEDSLVKWTIAKEADPVTFDFGNTCNMDVPDTKEVLVTITFTKGATEYGELTATTTAQATNPSSRFVRYNCTDEVYGVPEGGSTEQLLSTELITDWDVDPGMASRDIEHILSPGSRQLRDVLTCQLSVEDILTPGSYLLVGTLSAEASLPDADIAAGDVVNEQVVVTDVESITAGTVYYDFSAAKTGGVSGAFVGYTPGDFGDGPVNWESSPQSDSGTVQFTKTVRVQRGVDAAGTLEDTASIDLTDTTDVTATASTTFSTQPLIDLVINKSLGFTVANETVWDFVVKAGACDGSEVATAQITIAGGSGSGTTTVHDLSPGTYCVSETVPSGWVPAGNPQNVTLTLPSCEGSVDFTNNPAAGFYAQVEVKKITNPTGSEAGWTFDLTGSGGGESAMVTTTSADFIRFNLDGGLNAGADPGSYVITEQGQAGWDLQVNKTYSVSGCLDSDRNVSPMSVESCTFNVQYDRDAGCVFQCAFENIQQGTIIVEKQTDPDGSAQSFVFEGDAAGTLFDGGRIEVANLQPGTYTSEEIVPAGWDLTSIECDDQLSTNPSSGDIGEAAATFNLDPGETVTCTFTNRERGSVEVLKTVEGLPPGGAYEAFVFELRKGATEATAGQVIAQATTDATTGEGSFSCTDGDPPCLNVEGVAKLVPVSDPDIDCTAAANASAPGCYQFCETALMPGWTSSLREFTNAFPLPDLLGSYFVPTYAVDPMVDNSIYCVPIKLLPGATLEIEVDNTPPPGGDARTPGFWKNWNTCTGGGQEDVLGEALACSTGGFIWVGDVQVNECYEAVSILDMREIDASLKGKKMSNDACYLLASKLLAAELNTADCIGANNCAALEAKMTEAQTLLNDNNFDGDGKCLDNKDKSGDFARANQIAYELDEYLNNQCDSLCNPPCAE